MGRVAAITGGVGDAIYAIPVMRALGVTLLYIKENYYPPGFGSMYTALKPLMESQGIECLPTRGGLDFEVYEPGLQFDYDLDQWRHERGRGRVHIMFSMLTHFKRFNRDWKLPWLKNVPVSQGNYNLIFLTWRWRENSRVDWSKILKRLYCNTPNSETYFIGLPEDYSLFCSTVSGGDLIEHKITKDLLEMAHLIAGCQALYCNQGVALVLSQGLGKEYYCAFKPTKTNTMLYTSNEHNLNNYKEYEKTDH